LGAVGVALIAPTIRVGEEATATPEVVEVEGAEATVSRETCGVLCSLRKFFYRHSMCWVIFYRCR
jgi:hypothetical protein